MKILKYWELPKPLQEKADDYSEFLEKVGTIRFRGHTVYVFVFGDSFERWVRVYYSNGSLVIHDLPFIPREEIFAVE